MWTILQALLAWTTQISNHGLLWFYAYSVHGNTVDWTPSNSRRFFEPEGNRWTLEWSVLYPVVARCHPWGNIQKEAGPLLQNCRRTSPEIERWSEAPAEEVSDYVFVFCRPDCALVTMLPEAEQRTPNHTWRWLKWVYFLYKMSLYWQNVWQAWRNPTRAGKNTW